MSPIQSLLLFLLLQLLLLVNLIKIYSYKNFASMLSFDDDEPKNGLERINVYVERIKESVPNWTQCLETGKTVSLLSHPISSCCSSCHKALLPLCSLSSSHTIPPLHSLLLMHMRKYSQMILNCENGKILLYLTCNHQCLFPEKNNVFSLSRI